MAESRAPVSAPAVGLIVNPIAGLGGRVGLKGTDGAGTAERARALGAEPSAPGRAAAALGSLRDGWPAGIPLPRLITGPGTMGAVSAAAAGYPAVIVGEAHAEPTTAADTRALAAVLLASGVDLLLFAGGDGTARDVQAVVGERAVVLGIPAGVKVQSAVFATSPVAAGGLAATYLSSGARRTGEREVLDLDEEAYRRGEVAPRLFGYLLVPDASRVQARKAPSPRSDAAAAASIAADIVEAMVPGCRYVLGPGTTVRAVAVALGLPKTLVGVDVVEITPDGPALVAADAGGRQVREAVGSGPVAIVVTPIGGQGFLFGRGNQPIGPDIIRLAGRTGLLAVATPAKLAALGGRPLLLDTGDAGLDRELTGFLSVTTGYRERAIVAVEPA